MSPQLENGYTKIADAILENMSQAKLNGTQFRILMVVWRSTYGWNKKSHALSESFLAKATGINKQQIKRELKAMIQLGVLIETKAPTFNGAREIQFNKEYVNSIEVSKKIPGNEKGTITGSELDTTPGSELDTQKRDSNKHIKKEIHYAELFDYYLSLNLVKHRSLTEGMKKAIDHAMKQLNCDTEYLKVLLARHKDDVTKTKKNEFPVKARALDEFFGQKVFRGTALICAKYDYVDDSQSTSQEEIKQLVWNRGE